MSNSTFLRLEPSISSWLKMTGLWTLSACFLISSKIEATSWSCFAGLDSWSRIAAPNLVFFSFFAEFSQFRSNFYFDNLRFLNPGRLVFIGMNFEFISEDIFFVFLATVILVGIVTKFIFLGINNISSAIIWLFNPAAVVVVVTAVVVSFDIVVDSNSNSTCRSTSGSMIFGLPVGCCCPT